MKKVTLKEFVATLLCGIWNAIVWVVCLFGYKDDSRYGMRLKRIFATCVTSLMVLFTGVMLFAFVKECVYEEWLEPIIEKYDDYEYWISKRLSNHITLQYMYDGEKEEGRVYNEILQKVLLRNIDWVVMSDDKDSLAVFAQKGKRGYLNRFTGEVVIEPKIYTRAWVFSEGLAAVEKDGELLFIDHHGNIVIDKNFEVHSGRDYVFKSGYCAIHNPVDDKMGLIDKSGNVVIEMVYDDVYNIDGFWRVEKDDCVGLYTSQLELLLPIEYARITLMDGLVDVRKKDHTAMRCDYEGNVVVDFVIDKVENLQYETTELLNEARLNEYNDIDHENRKVYGVANCQRYAVGQTAYTYYYSDFYYGLLNRKGEVVTPPIYKSIEAIGKNLYLCDGVIINDSGKIVK